MYPKGKVSDIQERQMTSILDENVDCIAIEVLLIHLYIHITLYLLTIYMYTYII